MKRPALIIFISLMFLSPLLLVGETEVVTPQALLPNDLQIKMMVFEGGEPLTIDEATRIAVARNLNIQINRMDQVIQAREVSISKSRYDTELNINASYSHDQERQTSVVLGTRQIDGVLEASLQKKLPTGTTVKLKSNGERHSTTSTFTNLSRNYTGFFEVGVEQELLKNFFGVIDRAAVKKVKLNVKKFTYETLENIESSIFEVRHQYWNLVFAYKNLESRQKNFEKAKEFLKITQDKMELGLTEKPDRYAAEANLRKRIIDVKRAETELHEASYALKLLLNTEEVHLVIPQDEPVFHHMIPEFEEVYREVLEKRRDLKAMFLELEEQGVEAKIKWFERLPELRFEGRYTSTGLDRKLSRSQGMAYSFDDPKYYAGVEFNYPIENRAARGEYFQTKVELEKTKKRLEHLKLQIASELDSAIRNLKLTAERVRQTRKIYTLEEDKLAEEERNFNVGRSDSKTIIDFQEDLILAETDSIQALVDYAKALENYYQVTDSLIEEIGLNDDGIIKVSENNA